ncbi:hypothetical protein ITI46_09430 [Streptomyces oryzae]|uniref:Alpha-L-rhamnosidase C-terminal domain-containing protein n=1 Tax=Streptomyces oryzae TaxID=1434886 RepID=A0ABS3X986_9ACTN|nr:hypothetical protein [Streptomyces oryzae]
MDFPRLRPSARITSPYGTVATHWTRTENGRFTLDVRVPVNTTAEVWLPAQRREQVTQEGARFQRPDEGCAVFHTGSGTYRFVCRS